MKKIIFTMLIAMLAACGQQGSNTGGPDGAKQGDHEIEMTIDRSTLSKDTDEAKVTLAVFAKGGAELAEASVADMKFMVGQGLSFTKVSTLEYKVKRRANAKVGDIEVQARMSDGSSATGAIKVIKGSITFEKPPTKANSKQTIVIEVTAKDIGSKDEGRKLVAYIDDKEVGTPQVTKADGSAKFTITLDEYKDDKNIILKVVDAESGTSAKHEVAVKSLGADSITLSLVNSKGETVNFMPAGATDYKIKVVATGSAAGKTVTFTTTQDGNSVASCSDKCAVTAPNKGMVTVTGKIGSDIENTTSFMVTPAKATKAKLDYNKKISTKSNKAKAETYQSRILIKLTDADGTGVAGIKVTATKAADNRGGFLNPDNGEMITDNNGYAEVTFEAPADVPAGGKDHVIKFTAAGGPVIDDATINVKQRQLIVKLLTAGELKLDGDAFLIEPMVVIVTDNNGSAVDGAEVSISSVMQKAYFGCYGSTDGKKLSRDGDGSTAKAGYITPVEVTGGTIQSITVGGDTYDPKDPNRELGSGLTIVKAGTKTAASKVTTSDGGTAYIDMRYPRSESGWTAVDLSVTTKYGNLQDSFDKNYGLSIRVEDLTVSDVSPLMHYSPYNDAFAKNPDGTSFSNNKACEFDTAAP